MSETATSTPFPLAAPFFEGDERSNRERMLAGDWYLRLYTCFSYDFL